MNSTKELPEGKQGFTRYFERRRKRGDRPRLESIEESRRKLS